uniref:(northern house mosquito) hypothetical protein n=1 Tax=Culex pipiens TaxID=7175 RepID=A0A8D7ZTS6_CULPI
MTCRQPFNQLLDQHWVVQMILHARHFQVITQLLDGDPEVDERVEIFARGSWRVPNLLQKRPKQLFRPAKHVSQVFDDIRYRIRQHKPTLHQRQRRPFETIHQSLQVVYVRESAGFSGVLEAAYEKRPHLRLPGELRQMSRHGLSSRQLLLRQLRDRFPRPVRDLARSRNRCRRVLLLVALITTAVGIGIAEFGDG